MFASDVFFFYIFLYWETLQFCKHVFNSLRFHPQLHLTLTLAKSVQIPFLVGRVSYLTRPTNIPKRICLPRSRGPYHVHQCPIPKSSKSVDYISHTFTFQGCFSTFPALLTFICRKFLFQSRPIFSFSAPPIDVFRPKYSKGPMVHREH